MILGNGQLLDSIRLNRLILDQSTRFNQQMPLRFLDRLRSVDADDGEIIATETAKIYAADIVADDQPAAVYAAGQLQLVTNVLPNLKVGLRVSQAMMQRLERIAAGAATRGDQDLFGAWQVQKAVQVVQGVRERMNVLACGMMIDSLNYDRLGIKFTGTWGMPSALKVTVGVLWTDATNATPITDILTARQTAANTYGTVLNRVTMSTADFLLMVATAQFKQQVTSLLLAPLATTAFNPRDPRMLRWASELLQMEIVLEDKTFRTQGTDASETLTRVLPLGKVLLDNNANDGSGADMDWGNAIVAESIVARLTGDPDTFPGAQFGPFGYYTSGNADLNPPNLMVWGVTRGFPRKFNKFCTACLTVQ
jgi:hypothetical protein